MKRRIVAVDYGTRRVGIAMTDPLQIFAQPVGTYSPDEAVECIVRISDRDGIDVVLFGWPVGEDGEENRETELVATFAASVMARLEGQPDPAVMVRWDERDSSKEATEELIRAGATRRNRGKSGARDRVAAAILLQQYLDDRNEGGLTS